MKLKITQLFSLPAPSFAAVLVVMLGFISLPVPAESVIDTGSAVSDQAATIGKKIYLEGILSSGEPLQGTVQGDVPTAIVCVSCHRRSGLGASESGILISPVTGRALFQPKEARRQKQYQKLYQSRGKTLDMRGAYTDETLARAIRQGVNPRGETLNKLMPRYALSETDSNALIAYLKTLGATSDPGVSDTTIHFATIITEDVESDKREAMLSILNTYIRDRNAETRNEIGRAKRGPWYKDYFFKAYREWKLHIWDLKGPPASWTAQLEAYYQLQPVFAVLSGLSNTGWRPVHDFCEQAELPCLFPNVDLPTTQSGSYNVYFSKGVTLEAEALAQHLREEKKLRQGIRIVQLYSDDERGKVAAQALREAVQRDGRVDVIDRLVKDRESIPTSFWQEAIKPGEPIVLVLWLSDISVIPLGALSNLSGRGLEALYLPSALFPDALLLIPRSLQDKILFTYPFALPEPPTLGLRRSKVWMHQRKLKLIDERIQANTHFVAVTIGSAVKRMLDNYSRNYLMERIEHMAENVRYTGVYSRLTLGPGQRFASKGCYIVKPSDTSKGGLVAVSDWIIP